MDEYVHDLIGMPFEGDEAKSLTEHIRASSHLAMSFANDKLKWRNKKEAAELYYNCCNTMFLMAWLYK